MSGGRRAPARRLASVLLGGALVWAAIVDAPWIGGEPGFGWTQTALLLVGLALGASALAHGEWNARVLSLVVATLVGVAVAELVLQRVVGGRYARTYQTDPRLLYRLVPGAVSEYRRSPGNGGDRIEVRINTAGFRGEELAEDPRAVRVAVYGDSFIQAVFSTQPNTFAARLERRLAERLGPAVEVVNAGVAGYGPDQILRKMEDELPRLRPDVALVAIFAGNDFGDLLRNKLYRLAPDGHLQENLPVLSPELERGMAFAGRELVLKRVARDALRALGVARASNEPDLESMSPVERMELFLELRRQEYLEYVEDGDDVVRNLTSDSYDADVSLAPASDSARYKIALMEAIIGRIRDLAARESVALALLLIPHPLDLCGHDTGEVDRARHPDYDPRRPTVILEGIADRHAIPRLNLFEPLEALGEQNARELFFRGLDDHWSDRGQDVAAGLTVDFLQPRGLLDARLKRVGRVADRSIRDPSRSSAAERRRAALR
jgi:hypothetical protein